MSADGAPGARGRQRLHPTVVALGLVSLLTDASSEMIYPLLPLFLTTVLGAGTAAVGLIEGAAESTAALLKLLSGRLSDRLQRRKPLVVLGYGLSALCKPLFGLAQGAGGVLALRLLDRVGKGVRSSPRDALLADATPPSLRGRAYGLHRAMDNAGAVLGPLFAFALLAGGVGLRSVFLLSALPALLAVLTLAVFVRERARREEETRTAAAPEAAGPAPPLPADLRRYLVAVAIFSLGNSSDAFVLLWARQAGVPQAQIPLLWMGHNAVRALLAAPLGALSDRWGRHRSILCAFFLYGLVYLGFGTQRSVAAAWILFAAYGLYYALLEGAEKALVADLAPPQARGRAFGWFHGIVGAAALPASLLFARLYESAPPQVGALRAFGAGAALAGLAALVLTTVPAPPRPAAKQGAA